MPDWRRARWLLLPVVLLLLGAVSVTFVRVSADCATAVATFPYVLCVETSPLAVFFAADTLYTQSSGGSGQTPSLQAVTMVGATTTTGLTTQDAGDADLRCTQSIVGGIPGLRCYNAAGTQLTFNNDIYAGQTEVLSIDNGAGTQVACKTTNDAGLATFAAVESCGSQNLLAVTGATTLAQGPIVTDATASTLARFNASKKLVSAAASVGYRTYCYSAQDNTTVTPAYLNAGCAHSSSNALATDDELVGTRYIVEPTGTVVGLACRCDAAVGTYTFTVRYDGADTSMTTTCVTGTLQNSTVANPFAVVQPATTTSHTMSLKVADSTGTANNNHFKCDVVQTYPIQ
jgi:hypothetical protein